MLTVQVTDMEGGTKDMWKDTQEPTTAFSNTVALKIFGKCSFSQ